MAQLKSQRNALSLVFQFGVAPPDHESAREDLAFIAARRHAFFDDAVIDLFEQPRHRGHNRWLHLPQIFGHLIDGRRIVNRDTHVTEDIKNRALENVRQRQDRKRNVRGINRQPVGNPQYVGNEIVVGEHDALGFAGRAGGVDDRSQIVTAAACQ